MPREIAFLAMESFESFTSIVHDDALAYASTLTSDDETAEKLVKEAVAKIYERTRPIEPGVNSAWIRFLVHRTILDAVRPHPGPAQPAQEFPTTSL